LATPEELSSAALQFVLKISGFSFDQSFGATAVHTSR
jgi:hypothetical protein